MTATTSLQEQVDALERGIGILDLDGWILVEVLGGDSEGWLNDLVTANVSTLQAGGSVRSLLLGPTGRIRADLVIHRLEEGALLLQSPGQPRPVDELLEPYVLSSDVTLSRRVGAPAVRPSPSGAWEVGAPPEGVEIVGPEAFEAWRIRSGFPRFPADLDEDSVPAEAALDRFPTIDRGKGCYLGQESVAKIRNLGHPTRLVAGVRASRPVEAGQQVVGGDGPLGVLTSVDVAGGSIEGFVRIRWEARESDLATADGASLQRR